MITARSGSKGLKDKNIKELKGKPLIAYSIDAAYKAEIFDCVHVSTDSEQYARIAREYGADVPFLRSDECSSDYAGSWDVVLEVLEKYKAIGKQFDTICLLQPTSPLRTADDIRAAYSVFCAKKAGAVVSVCEMDHSPLWSNTLPEDLSMDSFQRPEGNFPRQMLPLYYRVNGAIYFVDIDFLEESTKIIRKGCYAYIMDKERSIDIDTQFDFDLAEYLINKI